MTPIEPREGPAFLRRANGSIKEGWWTEDPQERLESRLPFEIIFGNPDRPPDAGKGFFIPTASSGESSPPQWERIHYLPGDDPPVPDAIHVVEPGSVSPVRLLALADQGTSIFLDLRDCGRRSSLFHTLPVMGWIQQDHQRPPPYDPKVHASAREGIGPLWWLQHGFTGGPDNWSLVRRHLSYGPWKWIIPLLPGHGLPTEEFGNFGCDDWVGSVRTLGEWVRGHTRTVLGIGLSMGGALMIRCWEQFDAMVLINTPINLPDWRRHFLPFLSMFRSYYYPDDSEKVIPVSSLLALRRLLRENREVYPIVDCPVLILNHREDKTVPAGHGLEMAERLPRARRHVLPGGPHEATDNPEALPDIFRVIADWAQELPFAVPELDRFRTYSVEGT